MVKHTPTSVVTIERFIIEQERQFPEATGELSGVLYDVALAAKMIATVDDLEAIAVDDRAPVQALSGWRKELFGIKALELKRGRLALTVENGKVVTLEWRDAENEAAE